MAALVYSVPETARVLGISKYLAYRMVREGRIPSFVMGRRIVVPKEALAEHVNSVARKQAS